MAQRTARKKSPRKRSLLTAKTTSGPTTPDTTNSGETTNGTTTSETNLLLCNECDKPFPVPPLTRTYRIYVPLTDLVTTDGTLITSPHTIGTHLSFDPRSAAMMDRAVDAFGGIPLNALDKAKDPRWNKPVLTPVVVSDPAALVRSMKIAHKGGSVQLTLSNTNVSELLEGGSTLAARADGGFIRLKLAGDIKVPTIQNVNNLEAFLQEPSVVLPDGRRRQLNLTSAQLASLASGRPVVSGSGSNTLVLMRTYQQLAPSTGSSSNSTNYTQMPPFKGNILPLAILLPLDQTWLLTTYERGRIAASISLTSQEEVTVDVYSWDRKKTSLEDTSTFDSETSAESQGVDRDTKDVFGEATKTGAFNWGLNGSFSGYGLTIGGSAGNNANVGNITRNTQQTFHEATVKASEKVKTSRQLKITESEETGSENRITRKLRNNNLCHTLTYHYFQLDAQYRVTTQYTTSEAVFVILVPNPLPPPYTIDYIRAHETVLRGALLDSAVAGGFDAARTIWKLQNATSVICNDCACPADCAGTEDSPNFQAAISAARAMCTVVTTLLSNAPTLDWRSFFQTMVPFVDTNNNPVPFNPLGPGVPLPLAVRRALFVDAIDEGAPGLLTALASACAMLPASPNAAQLAAFNLQFSAIDLKGIDTALLPDTDLQTRIKGLVEARVRTTYNGMALRIVQFLAAGNRTGNPIIDGALALWDAWTQTENNSMDKIVNFILAAMANSPGFGATDAAGLKQFAQALSTTLAAWTADTNAGATAAADTKRAHQALFASVFPPADLLTAQERFDALVRHLQAYGDYYANVMITDLISRGQFRLPPALLPYLGCISLQPVAVVDGQLAYAIDLSASTQFDSAATYLQTIVGQVDASPTTSDVALPTPGFVVEPKLSCCSACEDFVEQSRTIQLELKKAEADQAKFEASRREQLLAASQYGPFDPIAPAVKVDVEQTPPGA